MSLRWCQAQRHQIKKALTGFNAEVEQVLFVSLACRDLQGALLGSRVLFGLKCVCRPGLASCALVFWGCICWHLPRSLVMVTGSLQTPQSEGSTGAPREQRTCHHVCLCCLPGAFEQGRPR